MYDFIKCVIRNCFNMEKINTFLSIIMDENYALKDVGQKLHISELMRREEGGWQSEKA